MRTRSVVTKLTVVASCWGKSVSKECPSSRISPPQPFAEAGDSPQQGRFSRTVAAYEGDQFPGGNRRRGVLQQNAVAVTDSKVVQSNHTMLLFRMIRA